MEKLRLAKQIATKIVGLTPPTQLFCFCSEPTSEETDEYIPEEFLLLPRLV